MKNWWRNKGQISKNGHLKLVSYTFKKQPDFSQELGICQLPACSGGKTGRCRPSENLLGAYVLPQAAVFSLPLTACAGLRINGKSNLKQNFCHSFFCGPATYRRSTSFITLACTWQMRQTLSARAAAQDECRVLFMVSLRKQGTFSGSISKYFWYSYIFPSFSLISHCSSCHSKGLSSLSLQLYSRYTICLSDPLPNRIISHLHECNETYDWFDFVVWVFQDLIPFFGIICPPLNAKKSTKLYNTHCRFLCVLRSLQRNTKVLGGWNKRVGSKE